MHFIIIPFQMLIYVLSIIISGIVGLVGGALCGVGYMIIWGINKFSFLLPLTDESDMDSI